MVDYPLPPNEEHTEILRVVVRESMSLDLLDRLISDIFNVTQILIKSDPVDLQVFTPGSTSVEKQYSSAGLDHHHRHQARSNMKEGIHRSVC
ncbi:MAG: hypothetical protein H7X86_10435 [Gorillibacterium sp.]|nr:hypothetical protein [Gorillibacterium sp.]